LLLLCPTDPIHRVALTIAATLFRLACPKSWKARSTSPVFLQRQRKNQRIFKRKAAALSNVRGKRMSGIADDRYTMFEPRSPKTKIGCAVLQDVTRWSRPDDLRDWTWPPSEEAQEFELAVVS
jgi:hypothetical protein